MDITPPTVIPLDATQIVQVNRDLLLRASSLTGIEDPAELVRFAVQLVAQASPSSDILAELRGEWPGMEQNV